MSWQSPSPSRSIQQAPVPDPEAVRRAYQEARDMLARFHIANFENNPQYYSCYGSPPSTSTQPSARFYSVPNSPNKGGEKTKEEEEMEEGEVYKSDEYIEYSDFEDEEEYEYDEDEEEEEEFDESVMEEPKAKRACGKNAEEESDDEDIELEL